jgi:hypothetical protein
MAIARRNTVTTQPETPPPQLFCPVCDKPLVYRDTVIAGVGPLERYDRFACRATASLNTATGRATFER